jgi:hypothetical protein
MMIAASEINEIPYTAAAPMARHPRTVKVMRNRLVQAEREEVVSAGAFSWTVFKVILSVVFLERSRLPGEA